MASNKVFLPRIPLWKVIRGSFKNRCPRCDKAKVFRRFLKMRETCPKCGYFYHRENGYFIGAALLGYFVASFSVIPTLAIGMVSLHYPPEKVIVAASIQLIVLCPLISRWARLAWIHFDYCADPTDLEDPARITEIG